MQLDPPRLKIDVCLSPHYRHWKLHVIDMATSPLLLAENIMLLQKTCNKPIPPTHNRFKDIAPPNAQGRVLDIRQELDIAECLTYLSAYSNHPHRVMALCLEERGDHQGLIVSVATNDGSLAYLQQGVRSLVQILEQQARCSMPSYILNRQTLKAVSW
jgi:hypothetical protein